MMSIRFEQADGLDKVDFTGRHDHIDGVEIFLAIKAAGQIGAIINSGIALGAYWTAEAQGAAVDFGRHPQQVCDHRGDGDIISQVE